MIFSLQITNDDLKWNNVDTVCNRAPFTRTQSWTVTSHLWTTDFHRKFFSSNLPLSTKDEACSDHGEVSIFSQWIAKVAPIFSIYEQPEKGSLYTYFTHAECMSYLCVVPQPTNSCTLFSVRYHHNQQTVVLWSYIVCESVYLFVFVWQRLPVCIHLF